ncbi:DUF559 domain-containing protein [Microbacterium sp. ABRD28]|uniref:DUF559 domain-containing protein n=1 Tax=Microbacterium sp. ABRD28 TaxID=2268461 RepID=UPI000F554D5E|nr:DUF559 domain-containing protein [Microbacterium sp. ABRD28]AZC13950.1 DUF559 domain-containing protein [Microbacterium sp. ABRD28]
MDAGAQRGVFTVADARRRGKSRRWVDRAELGRPFHGVRAEPRAHDDAAHPFARQRAAIVEAALQFSVRLNDGGCFSHTTAALLWDLPLPHLTDPRVHVSTPGRAPRAAGTIGHQVRPDLVTVVRHPRFGVPVSDPATTWAMLAPMIDAYGLVAVGDAIVRSPRVAGPFGYVIRPALADMAELRHAATMGRRLGAQALRAALERIRSGVASRTETWARLLLVDAGLPEPVTDHDVYGAAGEFLGCVDLAYPELRIAIEYEGDQHRTDAAQWQRDLEKHERLTDAGWRVIRVARDQLFRYPLQYVDRVRVALSTRR